MPLCVLPFDDDEVDRVVNEITKRHIDELDRLLSLARARNADLQAALIAVRDKCTYANLISQKREPRFVMANAKEIIAIVDAALEGA